MNEDEHTADKSSNISSSLVPYLGIERCLLICAELTIKNRTCFTSKPISVKKLSGMGSIACKMDPLAPTLSRLLFLNRSRKTPEMAQGYYKDVPKRRTTITFPLALSL